MRWPFSAGRKCFISLAGGENALSELVIGLGRSTVGLLREKSVIFSRVLGSTSTVSFLCTS